MCDRYLYNVREFSLEFPQHYRRRKKGILTIIGIFVSTEAINMGAVLVEQRIACKRDIHYICR